MWIISSDSSQIKRVENIVTAFGESMNSLKAVDDKFFVGTNKGLWIISKDGKQVQEVRNVSGLIDDIEVLGDTIIVRRIQGLWIVDKDGNLVNKIEGINQPVYRVRAFGDRFFAATSEGLWIINKDGKPVNKVEGINEKVYEIGVIGDELFISTDKGIWIISKDGKAVRKVESVSDSIQELQVVGDTLFAPMTRGLWIINKGGKQVSNFEIIKAREYSSLFFSRYIDLKAVGEHIYIKHERLNDRPNFLGEFIITLYRVDPKVKIDTHLVPSGWWATVISYILPSNWLPSEKVQAKAFYSDENGTDPYNKSIQKEFSFAIADGDALPPEGKFSTQEQFSYEIGWGKNTVRYWVKDKWGNISLQTATYYGVPSQYFFVALPFILSVMFVLGCFAFAPKVGFAHSAIMNPWLRNYFSLGSVPLLLSVSTELRRYILRRYSDAVNNDKEFTEWKGRFVYPDEAFLPENFGKRLETERRLLLTGQSGIGKTSFFKHLTAYYVSEDKPKHPAKVFPVYISLTNYGGNSLEELVYTQLFSYGKITDKGLAPMFLEQGGLLIFLDGVNEVQNVSNRQKLSEFVEKLRTSNYICLSSQQSYPEIDNIPKVELKAFGPKQVREFIRQRVNDKETAERVIKGLKDEDYHLYNVPRDLEFAVEILNSGANSLPKSRTALYKIVFSSIFARWKESGNADAKDILCDRAYRMIVGREMAFDSADSPKFKEISEDLFKQKFLVKREGSYNFRHDLIRAYLASEFFYLRWENLLQALNGKPIDSNWLEMLKFSCEKIVDTNEVQNLLYEVLEKSVRKDLVKSLFRWLKDNHPGKCTSWEIDFYAKYGESDFK